MKIQILKGTNIEADKINICDNINDTIFVLDGDIKLCDYIDSLRLSNSNLLRLQICKEINNIDIDVKKNNVSPTPQKIFSLTPYPFIPQLLSISRISLKK